MRTVPLLLVLLVTLPLFAQAPDNEIAIGFGAGHYTAEVGESTRDEAATFSCNRFWTRAFSTRLGVTQYGLGSPSETGNDIGAKTLVAEYHPRRTRFLSPYGGAGVSYVGADVQTRHFSGRAESELVALVKLGADLNLARWFGLGADATYMSWEPEFSNGWTADITPLTVTGAVKFRF